MKHLLLMKTKQIILELVVLLKIVKTLDFNDLW